MKTPITKDKLQNHFAYSWWKYCLLVVLAAFGWNMIYSMTEYRAPEEKKIIVGVYAYADEASANAYMEQVRSTRLPEMEEMAVTLIAPDQMYGDMILSTRIAARECDVYILPREQFQGYAAQGAFMPLEEVLPGLVADLETAQISLSRGKRAHGETDEKHQYGIPCAELPGLSQLMQIDASDMYAAVFFSTDNDDNVLIFFDQFIRDMMVELADQPDTTAQ